MNQALVSEIVAECRRQEMNAQYTSTQLFMWLRDVRSWKRLYITSQVGVGALAAFFSISGSALWAGVFGAVAGVAPVVWDSLKLDAHEESLRFHASEFTRLRDRFRQTRTIAAARGLPDLEQSFSTLMEDMDAARKASLTPSERYFQRAKRKIEVGDYDHKVEAG